MHGTDLLQDHDKHQGNALVEDVTVEENELNCACKVFRHHRHCKGKLKLKASCNPQRGGTFCFYEVSREHHILRAFHSTYDGSEVPF